MSLRGNQNPTVILLLKHAIAKDIETLLNTRRYPFPLPPHLPQLQQSLLTYGLIDFTAWDFSSLETCERLRKEVLETLQKHEPRLQQPVVELASKPDASDGAVKLNLSGWVSSPSELLILSLELAKKAAQRARVTGAY